MQKPRKKPKLVTLNAPSTAKPKGKEKTFNREIIPIPANADDDNVDLSDQDLELLEEHGSAANFLTTLDKSALARYGLFKVSSPMVNLLHF